MSGGVLVRMVFVQVVFVRGGFCPYTDKGGLHIDEKIVGLSISQWLPCPLAIWNLLFEMAILLKSC